MNSVFIAVLVFTVFLSSFTYSKYNGHKLLRLKTEMTDKSANKALWHIMEMQLFDIDPVDTRHLLVPHEVADILAEVGVRFESRNVDEIFGSVDEPEKNAKENWSTKEKRYVKSVSKNNKEKELEHFCDKYIKSNRKLDKSEFVDEDIIYNKVHDYLMILKWLKTIERKYPKLLKVKTYGDSYEGKCLVYAEVNGGKDVVMADGGVHSREWGSVTSVLILLHKLVHALDEGDVLLEDFTFIIIPVYNPDGYQFTHYEKRLWRKNRAPTIDKDCFGVDLNRNFAVGWDKCQQDRHKRKLNDVSHSEPHNRSHNKAFKRSYVGKSDRISTESNEKRRHRRHSSSVSMRALEKLKAVMTRETAKEPKSDYFYCSSTYKGKHSNSEPETRAFIRLVQGLKVVVYFNVHTYGNMWLHPYGYIDGVVPLQHNRSMEAAIEAVRKIEDEHGVIMELGSVWELVGYQACGSVMDWMVDYTGATYVYSLELTAAVDYDDLWDNKIGSMFDIKDEDIKRYGDVLYTGVTSILMHVEPNT